MGIHAHPATEGKPIEEVGAYRATAPRRRRAARAWLKCCAQRHPSSDGQTCSGLVRWRKRTHTNERSRRDLSPELRTERVFHPRLDRGRVHSVREVGSSA